jgi:tetratricopeptide (TPR) repeat protein
MRIRFTRGALICAVLPLGLLAGCADLRPIGQPGYDEFKAGDYQKADVHFRRDMDRYPDSTIAQFNMGDAYHHDGDTGKADGMFHTVAADGKAFVPDKVLELGGENRENLTASAVACRHLHEDRQLDANCGDQMVAIVTPAPAVEEAPPAVEAEATAPPPAVYKRKQDRN